MFLAVLFAACGKEGDGPLGDGRIGIFTNPMAGGDTKVLVNPAAVNNASWVAGEQIDLNGTACTIAGNSTDGFYLDGVAPLSEEMYAIYPATMKDALGNDIVVTNGGDGACAIDIHCLAVNFRGDGTHDVYFPMAAHTAAGGTTLLFDHLTGGLKLTLTNATSDDITVDRLVVTATQDGGAPAIYKDLRPAWAGSPLPGIPGGEVGAETGDQGAQFISDMTLRMNTNGSTGVTLTAGSSLTFCIPMLAKDLRHLAVTGYHNGSPVFSKSKDLGAEKDIERNKMYTLPTINID